MVHSSWALTPSPLLAPYSSHHLITRITPKVGATFRLQASHSASPTTAAHTLFVLVANPNLPARCATPDGFNTYRGTTHATLRGPTRFVFALAPRLAAPNVKNTSNVLAIQTVLPRRHARRLFLLVARILRRLLVASLSSSRFAILVAVLSTKRHTRLYNTTMFSASLSILLPALQQRPSICTSSRTGVLSYISTISPPGRHPFLQCVPSPQADGQLERLVA